MKKILLYILIIVGIALRLIKFGQVPISLNRDEAALGYNAYAISTMGIDEWGEKYPIFFKSFGDYKLPGYIYTLEFIIKLFGLNEITTRLPSLVAGLSLIPLSYLLGKKLNLTHERSLFLSALVSVSPWAIFYSRVAFEANLSLAFLLASLIAFLNPSTIKSTMLAILLFLISIITYNTPLIISPFLLLVIALQKKQSVTSKLFKIGAISLVSISWFFITKPLFEQKNDITIFSDPSMGTIQREAYSQANSFWQKAINHKYTYYTAQISQRLASSLAPNFLVTNGGQNPWHSLPGRGHFNWTTYILFIAGLLALVRNAKSASLSTVILLGAGFLPAIITVDAPHATRSLLAFVIICLIAASQKYTPKAQVLLSLILLVETSLFSIRYFSQFPISHAPEWQVGLKEQIMAATTKYPNQNIAIIKPQEQPYIYTLYYTKTPPDYYRQTVESYGPDASGLENIKSYGQWQFFGDIKDVPENTPAIYRLPGGEYKLIVNKYAK